MLGTHFKRMISMIITGGQWQLLSLCADLTVVGLQTQPVDGCAVVPIQLVVGLRVFGFGS